MKIWAHAARKKHEKKERRKKSSQWKFYSSLVCVYSMREVSIVFSVLYLTGLMFIFDTVEKVLDQFFFQP